MINRQKKFKPKTPSPEPSDLNNSQNTYQDYLKPDPFLETEITPEDIIEETDTTNTNNSITNLPITDKPLVSSKGLDKKGN